MTQPSEPFVPPVPQAPAPPPGAYRVPVGGYQAPVGGYAAPPAAPPSRATGAWALIASLVAAIVMPIVAGLLSLQIGMAVPVENLVSANGDFVPAALSPVRTETLWAEIAFWAGTALGLFAIVLGIVAAARRRGRALGITAIVIAVLGSGIFAAAVAILYGVGNAISLTAAG